MEVAGGVVGVDDSYGLQIGVDDSCSHKFHSALFQVARHGIRQRCARFPGFDYGFTGGETPNVVAERTEFLLDLQENFGIGHSSRDFQFVAY